MRAEEVNSLPNSLINSPRLSAPPIFSPLWSWSAACVSLGCFYKPPMTQAETRRGLLWDRVHTRRRRKTKTNRLKVRQDTEHANFLQNARNIPVTQQVSVWLHLFLIPYWYEWPTFQSRGSHGVIYLIWQSHPDSAGVGGALMGNHSVDSSARPLRQNNDPLFFFLFFKKHVPFRSLTVAMSMC